MFREEYEKNDDSKNAASAPSPGEMEADLAKKKMVSLHQETYPARAFTSIDVGSVATSRWLDPVLVPQFVALSMLQSTLEGYTIPEQKRNVSLDEHNPAWMLMRGRLRHALSLLTSRYRRGAEEQTVREHITMLRAFLRQGLGYALQATGNTPELQQYLEEQGLYAKAFRPDLLLTFFSHHETRAKVAALIGEWWLHKNAQEFCNGVELDEKSITECGLLAPVRSFFYKALTAMVQEIRVIPRLAHIVHMESADMLMLKKDMACMGKADGIYLILHRPALQEKTLQFLDDEQGLRTKLVVEQPPHHDICRNVPIGDLLLTNLSENSCVVAHIPVDEAHAFSLRDVFADYDKESHLLKGIHVHIVHFDHSSDDDAFLDLDDDLLEDEIELEMDDTYFPQMDGNDEDDMDSLADETLDGFWNLQYMYGNSPWIKEIAGSPDLRMSLSVETLKTSPDSKSHIVVDLKEHGVYLNSPDGAVPLRLIDRLEDIV